MGGGEEEGKKIILPHFPHLMSVPDGEFVDLSIGVLT